MLRVFKCPLCKIQGRCVCVCACGCVCMWVYVHTCTEKYHSSSFPFSPLATITITITNHHITNHHHYQSQNLTTHSLFTLSPAHLNTVSSLVLDPTLALTPLFPRHLSPNSPHTHTHTHTRAHTHTRTHTHKKKKQKQSVSLPLNGHAIRRSRNARALSGPLSQCNATSWSPG